MRLPCVQIGKRALGAGHPPVLWPDIDVYFKRDLSQAFYLVDQVAEAGGQFLKGAVLHREDLCLRGSEQVTYYDKDAGQRVRESYAAVISRHVVPLESLDKVMRRAREAGLGVVLSVYDREGLAFAREAGALAVKVPSSNITHKALIEEVSACGLPWVLDTGRSKFWEIERAVSWAQSPDARGRMLLEHSPPGPPAPAERFHLRMMNYMAQHFSCPVGLSDHHIGLDMFALAVALGACVIEKGLVLDGAHPDIDVAHALPVSRLRTAIAILEESWQALGHERRPDVEVQDNAVDRMCIVARCDIAEGAVITRDMLDFAFPPLGVGAEDLDRVVGATAQQWILRGTPIGREAISCQGRS